MRYILDFSSKRKFIRVAFFLMLVIYAFLAGYTDIIQIIPLDSAIMRITNNQITYLLLKGTAYSVFLILLFLFLITAIKSSPLEEIFTDFFDIKRPSDSSDNFNKKNNAEILDRLNELEAQLSAGIPKSDYTTLVEDVTNNIGESVNQSLLKSIETKYGSRIAEEQHFNFIDDGLSTIVNELSRERSVVSTRSVINLLIGMGIAGFGIWILYGALTTIVYAKSDWHIPVLQFASRLSVAIIIEIFAYFFLNLYRAGLQEIKFFRNEMTNIMSRQVAMRAAMRKLDHEAIANIVSKLADTERNFILKKGESTIGLEQFRADREQDTQLVRSIFDAAKDGIKEGYNETKHRTQTSKNSAK